MTSTTLGPGTTIRAPGSDIGLCPREQRFVRAFRNFRIPDTGYQTGPERERSTHDAQDVPRIGVLSSHAGPATVAL